MVVTHNPNTDPTYQRPQQRSWPLQTPPHQPSSPWWSGGRGLSLQLQTPPQHPFSVGSSCRKRKVAAACAERGTAHTVHTDFHWNLPNQYRTSPKIDSPLSLSEVDYVHHEGGAGGIVLMHGEETGCIVEVVGVCVGVYVLPLFGRSEALRVFLSSSCVCLSQGSSMGWYDCCETLKTTCNPTTSTFYYYLFKRSVKYSDIWMLMKVIAFFLISATEELVSMFGGKSK